MIRVPGKRVDSITLSNAKSRLVAGLGQDHSLTVKPYTNNKYDNIRQNIAKELEGLLPSNDGATEQYNAVFGMNSSMTPTMSKNLHGNDVFTDPMARPIIDKH